MKKVLVCIVVALFTFSALPVFAAEKGASAKALANASDEAVFNRVSDWFATIGKSDEEKAVILAERKAKRAAAQAQKAAEKAAKEAEKAAKEAGKKAKGALEDLQKGLK